MKLLSALLFLFLAISLQAQDLSNFEKLLVPVLNRNPITGANGSTFSTSLGLFAYGRTINYYPTGASTAPPVIGQNLVNGRILDLPIWEAPVVAKGRFVFVERGAGSLPFVATALAMAADGTSAVTALPVVRENETTTRTSTIGVLPVTTLYGPGNPAAPHGTGPFLGYAQRHTLRVYDFDSSGRLEVDVRLYWATWLDLGILEQHRISVTQRDADEMSYPYYAEVSLNELFKSHWCYPNLTLPCGGFGAIFEILPVTPGIRYYALISTTDNQTNHIAIFTRRES